MVPATGGELGRRVDRVGNLPDADDVPSPPEEATPAVTRARSRITGRRIVFAVVIVLLAWAGAAGILLLGAAKDARTGLDQMQDLRGQATKDLPTFVDSVGGDSDDVAEEVGAQQLLEASHSFADAHDRVTSPVLAPLRYVPVLGRQLDSVIALSGAAETTTREASKAFEQLERVLEGSSEAPDSRVAAANEIATVLGDLHDDLGRIDLGPTEKLLPPLARARNQFVEDYDRVMNTLGLATTSVDGVVDLLQGPNRYLVLAANNAEMRAGSGMFLQVGVMDVAAGRFEVGDFTAAQDLVLAEPGTTPDPDVETNWGFLEPDREFRNVNLTPRFDESARMAAEMWNSSGRPPVDGVIAIDVRGLRDVLELVGPVDVGDGSGTDVIDASTVMQALLLDQYLTYEDFDLREERRDRLGRVATAVFESFNERPVAASRLLKMLQDAGASRSILLWSSKPVQQDAWVALGASGRLPDNSVMLSVLNRGGNKLDQFLTVRADMSSAAASGGHRISVDVSIANDTPEGMPDYVQGPHPRSGVGAGDYLGIVALTVPAGAVDVQIAGAQFGFAADDGPTRVITSPLLVSAGDETRFTISFELSDAWTVVEVQPSARVPATSWTAGSLSWSDDVPQAVDLDALS